MEAKRLAMAQEAKIQILPYTRIVGQTQLKLALELAFIAPRIGGVLLSGERGTGKSTAVRAFAKMMYEYLPVTLPINATEDRVVGGWKIDELMIKRKPVWQDGLLEEANGKLLYIDEINLLDDHIVNIILDVTSTGVLVVQREAQKVDAKPVCFTLVGTMNPEEGGLRPQLLDRFGLMVSVEAEVNREERLKIMQTVMEFDEVLSKTSDDSTYLDRAKADNQKHRDKLEKAKENFYNVKVDEEVAKHCVDLVQAFKAEGNRGDYIMALAARAYAARQGQERVTNEHVAEVARMVLQHRRPAVRQSNQMPWTNEDDQLVKKELKL